MGQGKEEEVGADFSLQDVSESKAAAGMCCVGNEPRLQNVVLRAELQ